VVVGGDGTCVKGSGYEKSRTEPRMIFMYTKGFNNWFFEMETIHVW